MKYAAAALAATALLCGVAGSALAQSTPPLLTLEDAYARVLAGHPALDKMQQELSGLSSARELAALPPSMRVAADLENAFGSGDSALLRGAELTVSLASAIEAADKRRARVAVADAEIALRQARAEAERLDLLAAVAGGFLEALAAKAAVQVGQRAMAQSQLLLDAISERVRRGGSAESAQLAAQADLLQAQGRLQLLEFAERDARRRLAAQWSDPLAEFRLPEVTMSLPSPTPDLSRLRELLQNSPLLRPDAQRERLSQAQLSHAQAAVRPDLDWQLGLRRLQGDDDWALVGGLSIPLGSATRAAPAIGQAYSALAAAASTSAGQRRQLEIALVELFGELEAASAEHSHITQQQIPALSRALEVAQRNYRAGAGPLLDWQRLQVEQVRLEHTQLSALVRGQRALIEIQRLTGDRLLVGQLQSEERNHE